MAAVKKTFRYGNQTVTLETGLVARQATAAVMVNMDDTVVLVTVVGSDTGVEKDFFPLTVNYQERSYAAVVFQAAISNVKAVPRKKKF